MIGARKFYWIAGILLVVTFGNAVWRTSKGIGGDPNPEHYTYMAPTERAKEFEALKTETESLPEMVSPESYFSIMVRFSILEDATRRARLEEEPTRFKGAFRGVVPDRDYDIVQLTHLRDSYVHAAQSKLLLDPERFERARESSGINKLPLTRTGPGDPLTAQSWLLFYFVGLMLAFGSFVIRIEKMDGSWWLSTSDARFWFWLAAWPVGIFRYPTEVDVKQQLIRGYRFATLVLTSCLSLTATACGGKRVKTRADKKEAPYAFHMDVATTTWPTYIGGNGAVFHPAPVQQTNASVTLPSNFYAGVWSSVPLGDRDLKPNFGREADLYVGWGAKLEGVSFDLNTTYVGVTPLGHYRGDVVQLSASAKRDISVGGQTLSPYASIAFAMPTRGNQPKRGIFRRGGVRWGWQLKDWKFGVSAELTHDSGAFGFDPGFLTQGSASISKGLSKHWRLELPIRWSKPISKLKDGRKNEFQAGFTLAYSK